MDYDTKRLHSSIDRASNEESYSKTNHNEFLIIEDESAKIVAPITYEIGGR